MTIGSQSVLGGRYHLTRRIAAGGMGEVWEARDEVLGRIVAAKVLSPALVDEVGFLARFRAEARHAAALSHPGVASVYDYGEEGQTAYLVMEYVDGPALSALLAREHPLSLPRIVSILAQTCSALDTAHRAGVVHRDIKPGNLLITASDRVKVTDFGISKLVGSVSLTSTGQVLGTPQYISPEQATGNPATPASDLYSLGVIGYEMIAGHPPFGGETPVALALAHVRQLPPPLSPDVPRELAATIESMLAKDPADRPTDAEELAERFRSMEMSRAGAATIAAPKLGVPMAVSTPDPELTSVASTIVAPTLVRSPFPTQGSRRRSVVTITFVVLVIAAMAIIVALARDGTAGTPPVGTGSLAPAETVVDPTSAATTILVPATAVQVTPGPVTTVAPTSPTVVSIEPAQFIGRSQADVTTELESLGYVVHIERVRNGGGERNTVVEIALEPGSAQGSSPTVTLFVSDGKDSKDGDEDNE